MILLLVAAMAIGLAVFQTLSDEFRRVTAVAAWLHVLPVARVASDFQWLADAPAIGSYLFKPAITVEELLRGAWTDGIGWVAWEQGQLVAGRIAALLYGPLLLAFAWRVRRGRPDLLYRRVHDLESLIETQTPIWPNAASTRQFRDLGARCNPDDRIVSERARPANDPGKTPVAVSNLLVPLAPPVQPSATEIALRPETWLRAQGLAAQLDRDRSDVVFTDATEPAEEWHHLSVDAVCEVFESRLGPPWTGLAGLRPSHRGLAALFALRIVHKESEANELLTVLTHLADRAWAAGASLDRELRKDGTSLAAIDCILAGPAGVAISRVAGMHAWLFTAMMGMLQAARKDRGVISTASFLWLKREDRDLWYALNSTGNAVAVAEAAAVCAQYRAERQCRQPLRRPAVYLAARSLIDDYLDLENPRIAQRRAAARERRPVGRKLADAAREVAPDRNHPG